MLALALLRRPGQPDQQPRPRAEEILAQRLARGEIDPDEYRQRLQPSRKPPAGHDPTPTAHPASGRLGPGPTWTGSNNLAVVLRVLGHRHRPRQRDRSTPQQLQAYQTQGLRQLRNHAYAHSPFYRRFHPGRIDRPLHELPVLTKAMVMEHFDQLVTDPAVRLAEVEAHLAALDRNQCYRAATGWPPPRARPAAVGSSCGTWTSGSPSWPPTTGRWTGPAPPPA